MSRRYSSILRYLGGIVLINIAVGMTGFAQQKPAIERLTAEWTRARDYTKEYLDAMPEDGLKFKPTPDIRSFAEQMLHLTSANFGFISTAAGIPNPYAQKNLEKSPEYSASKAELTKVVLESYDFVIAALARLDPAKFGEGVKLFGRYETTRGGALDKAFEHQTHHRGQTTIYLRLKGVKPPNERLF